MRSPNQTSQTTHPVQDDYTNIYMFKSFRPATFFFLACPI